MKNVETQTWTKSSTSGQHTASLQDCRAHWSLMLQQEKCGWQLFQLCSSMLRRINSPAPQKKRHDPQEQYSLKYWICFEYQLQLWKLHCGFQGMRWTDQNAQKTHSSPWEELNNTRTQKRISLHKEIRYHLVNVAWPKSKQRKQLAVPSIQIKTETRFTKQIFLSNSGDKKLLPTFLSWNKADKCLYRGDSTKHLKR